MEHIINIQHFARAKCVRRSLKREPRSGKWWQATIESLLHTHQPRVSSNSYNPKIMRVTRLCHHELALKIESQSDQPLSFSKWVLIPDFLIGYRPVGWRRLTMAFDEIQFRQAVLGEADSVATIARISRAHFLPFLPKLHRFEDEKKFYRDIVFSECQVWVAEEKRELVGFCAVRENWLDHLYLLPSHVGKTLGSTLLSKAKKTTSSCNYGYFSRTPVPSSFTNATDF